MAFLSNLTSGWPPSDPHDLWPHHCTTLRSGVRLTKYGGHRVIWPLVDPNWPLYDLQIQQCITLWSGVLPIWWSKWHSWAIWPVVEPLHDLWPKHYITLPSGLLPAKFGVQGAFLHLWMTFDLGWACKICSQTSWARPLTLSKVSAQYLKARRNVVVLLTYIQTDRLGYFSSIELGSSFKVKNLFQYHTYKIKHTICIKNMNDIWQTWYCGLMMKLTAALGLFLLLGIIVGRIWCWALSCQLRLECNNYQMHLMNIPCKNKNSVVINNDCQ